MGSRIVAGTGSPVLVGRAAELDALVSAAQSPPAVLLLEGEAGVGKTRLIEEFLARPELAGHRVLAGRCQASREPFPYGVVVEALLSAENRLPAAVRHSPLFGVLGRHLPELVPQLPPPPEPAGDSRGEAHRLFRAVRRLLALLGPLVLVAEDLQWADDGSRRLLRYLMSDPPPQTVVLVTYRPEESPGGTPLGRAHRPAPGRTSIRVRLDPLDAGDVRRLAAALLGEPDVSAEFAASLHRCTAGVPLLVAETVDALRDTGEVASADEAAARRLLDAAGVPASSREMAAERLGALSPAARRVTEAAAVLAEPVPAGVLAAVAGLDAARGGRALDLALERAALIETAGFCYGFRHDLAQRAVYGTIPGPRRQEMHRRAVRALLGQRPEPWARLSEHSRRAGDPAGALRFGEAAADRAIDAGDPATAIGLLQALLAAPDLGLATSDVDRLAAKLGAVAANGVSQTEVLGTLEGLLADGRLSPALAAEIRLGLGLLLVRQADGLEAARVEIEVALTGLGHRPDLAARGMAVLALPFIGATPLRTHLPWLDRVEALISATDDPRLRLTLTANNLCSRLHTGDRGAWAVLDDLPADAGTPEERRQLARLYCNAADAGAWTGHHRWARSLLRRGSRLAAGSGSPYVVSTARTTGMHVDWLEGAWNGLEQRATALREEYRDLLPVASELSLVLGLLAAARGAWERAAGYWAATGVHQADNAVTPVAIAAHGGMAGVLLAQDAAGPAAAEADRGLELLRTKGVWAWAGDLIPVAAEAYCRAGRPASAHALLAELDRETSALAAPMARAALAHARGIVMAHEGEPEAAARSFEQARAQYERLPAPYPAALTAERLSHCRLDQGDTEAAGALGVLADAFAALGAPRDAARCRHAFRSTGAVTPSRRGRRGYGDELSPREHDVARLLADGHTNREIGEALFLSVRTVEQHVANVLRKLRVRSRTEVVAIAPRDRPRPVPDEA
ncbi:AAA family ATPase [Streptomyces sp. LP05-1]|uniref:AAA family ATPase n=1 Tax=Streptomyces pyxinae TaxID=2970734 RepID=A0ABT2CGY8_9ACTN|nr:LuxR family transcriptional regulator [Streptomyces sp. LP05-1]MCS0636673.1 AAA family ATPase [Streptomyces sp. LP05-1]